jgi:hypothetical protein
VSVLVSPAPSVRGPAGPRCDSRAAVPAAESRSAR